MDVRGFGALIVLFIALGWCCAAPLQEDEVLSDVDKRALGDPPLSYSPYSTSFGFFPPMSGPGIKPLRPIYPGFFLNRFATTPPPPVVDPMASFFKARKEEFLNKLFDDITIGTDETDLQARSVVGAAADTDDDGTVDTTPTTTTKPKIDPTAFITKKFDFLATLFKTLNTSTPAPTVDPADPTATTVKPTIVPPGFWLPVTLPPKPPKPTKPPKPGKAKALLLDAIDEGLLKSVLAEVDPASPALATRQAAAPPKTTESFLDKFLHRLTEAPPTVDSPTSNLDSRSIVFPPGYWIPPYIYAAKMGIYLDKIFDTIDEAATANQEDDDGTLAKRSTGADPSSMILEELTSLKNEMVAAYLEGMKAATPAPTTKPGAKVFKKPVWGPKTTVAPSPAEQKATLLSDIFDKLAAVQQELLAAPTKVTATSADDGDSPVLLASAAATTTPAYWALDPTAVDIGGFYKTKTQQFLSDLFATKFSTTPASEE